MKNTSMREAAETWVSTFSHIPGTLIEKLGAHDEAVLYYDSDDFRLIASPLIECCVCGAAYEGDKTLVELARLRIFGQGVTCTGCPQNEGDAWGIGHPANAFPCAWGTLFSPKDELDQLWLHNHYDEVASLGLFVFESEELGYLLGIDGAGLDFYEAYWIPLYKQRGLQWHTGAA